MTEWVLGLQLYQLGWKRDEVVAALLVLRLERRERFELPEVEGVSAQVSAAVAR